VRPLGARCGRVERDAVVAPSFGEELLALLFRGHVALVAALGPPHLVAIDVVGARIGVTERMDGDAPLARAMEDPAQRCFVDRSDVTLDVGLDARADARVLRRIFVLDAGRGHRAAAGAAIHGVAVHRTLDVFGGGQHVDAIVARVGDGVEVDPRDAAAHDGAHARQRLGRGEADVVGAIAAREDLAAASGAGPGALRAIAARASASVAVAVAVAARGRRSGPGGLGRAGAGFGASRGASRGARRRLVVPAGRERERREQPQGRVRAMVHGFLVGGAPGVDARAGLRGEWPTPTVP
jgi:hypothetical protein